MLGAGISGLTCALRLTEAGHRVTVVSADPIEATTSHLAAAVWFPTSAGPHKAVARWSDLTFTALMEEARAGRPGAFVRESMSLFRHPARTAALGGRCRRRPQRPAR